MSKKEELKKLIENLDEQQAKYVLELVTELFGTQKDSKEQQ